MKIQYYLIHGVDESRKPKMLEQFKLWGLDNKNVKWMIYPNKYDLTEELVSKIVNQQPSISCGLFIGGGNYSMRPGVISCTFKHYLSLKDIVENGYDYGVIMEDSLHFTENINDRVHTYIKQLDEMYPGWDVIFDSSWKSYYEGHTQNGIYVYPKSNAITDKGHGGTRCAHFYLVTKECAKKLYDAYLPFNNAPDWYMNDLFRKLNIRSFWAEPSIAHVTPHESTAN